MRIRPRRMGGDDNSFPRGTAAMFAHELLLTKEVEQYAREVFCTSAPHKHKLTKLIRLQDHLDKVRAEIGKYASEKACLVDFAVAITELAQASKYGFEIEARWRPLIHEYEAAKRIHQQNPWSFLENA